MNETLLNICDWRKRIKWTNVTNKLDKYENSVELDPPPNLFLLNKPAVCCTWTATCVVFFVAMITNMVIKMIIWHDPKFSAMDRKLARMFTKITEINDVHFLFQETKMFHQTTFFYSTLDTAIGWHLFDTSVILSFTSNFFLLLPRFPTTCDHKSNYNYRLRHSP